jgi:hypothetical protein
MFKSDQHVSRFVHLVASHRQGLLLEGVGADDVEQKEDLFIFQIGVWDDQIVASRATGTKSSESACAAAWMPRLASTAARSAYFPGMMVMQ